MNLGIHFQMLFTLWIWEKFLRQLFIVSKMESLFRSDSPSNLSVHNQSWLTQSHELKRWSIVSISVVHIGHLEGPWNPFLSRFSQVRVFFLIRSHKKVLIFGNRRLSQTLSLHSTSSSCSSFSIMFLASLRVKLPLPFSPPLSLSFSSAFLIFLLVIMLLRS